MEPTTAIWTADGTRLTGYYLRLYCVFEHLKAAVEGHVGDQDWRWAVARLGDDINMSGWPRTINPDEMSARSGRAQLTEDRAKKAALAMLATLLYIENSV